MEKNEQVESRSSSKQDLHEKKEVLSLQDNSKEEANEVISPSSDRQIVTIYQDETLKRLFLPILDSCPFRFCHEIMNKVKARLEDLVQQNKTDTEIYQNLYHLIHEDLKNTKEYIDFQRSNAKHLMDKRKRKRAGGIRRLVFHDARVRKKFRSLLDIGCSEGSITAELGAVFDLDSSDVHGCDVHPLHEDEKEETRRKGDEKREKDKRFQFYLMSDPSKLDHYKSDSFDLVTSLMAFHHMVDPESILEEVYRVLRPGGIAVIREHDCVPASFSIPLDVMHGLYAMVWPEKKEMNDFKTHFAKYRTCGEWETFFKKKFKILYDEGQKAGRSPFRSYHLVLQKKTYHHLEPAHNDQSSAKHGKYRQDLQNGSDCKKGK